MPKEHQVILIHDGQVFSPYYFYNIFLREIAEYYRETIVDGMPISFRITDEKEFVMGKYRIDPIAIPLLLSLSQQIRLHQNGSVRLELVNVPSTNALLEFLYRSDFFYVAGDNTNPSFPKGRDIFAFDKKQLGGFMNRYPRPEHKVRSYALNDDPFLLNLLCSETNADERRDQFVEYYSYKVSEHFQPLLQVFTNDYVSFFVDVLSELITNGVYHSGTDVFALMFSDRFTTKFSISDNGIGFHESLSKKTDIPFYTKFELSNQIRCECSLPETAVNKALLDIFEAMYFSMIKSRVGLFDLAMNVVNEFHGYFRLHCDYAQVILSMRMRNEIAELEKLREEIRMLYSLNHFGKIEQEVFNQKLRDLISNSRVSMVKLFRKMWESYSEDARFSSIRFFPIRFRGVHIEVEISK